MHEVVVMSKYQVEEFSRHHIEDNCIIISINDTNYNTDIADNSKIIEVLNLTFDDITDTDLRKYTQSRIACQLQLMTIEDVKRIKHFVDKYRNIVHTIIVHCTAGISRSGAVGLVLCKYLNGDNTSMWKSNKYFPNKFVYRLMSEGFNLSYSEKDFDILMDKYLRISTYFDKTTKFSAKDIIINLGDPT